MAEDEKPITERLRNNVSKNAPIVRSEHYRTVYADTSKMGLSPWDIRITFGLLVEVEPGRTANEEQLTVIVSPQHAKTFLRIFADNIAAWENVHGEINDPLADSAAETAAIGQQQEVAE